MNKHKKIVTSWPPKLSVCAGAVVLQGNRALLVRQAKGQTLQGQWSIPWGIVEPEETPETAALRETYEEGGITAEIEGLLGIQNLPQQGWIGIVFLCRHLNGNPQSDGGIETDDSAYLSLEMLDHFDEPIESWCAWLVRRVLQGKFHVTLSELNNPYQPQLAFL